MNTETFKTVGRYMMIAGGTLFLGGFGMDFFARRADKAKLKAETDAEISRIKIERAKTDAELNEQSRRQRLEEQALLTERMRLMDKDTFARYQAEATAKASADALAKANDIRRDAESKVAAMKIEMQETITKLRDECAEKISKAEAKRDEAVEKYEAIDRLFTNKNDILKAKEKLEKIAAASEKQKETKNEIIESINSLF